MLSKEGTYLHEEICSDNAEGDTYTHVCAGLNAGKGHMLGAGVFTSDQTM